MISQKTSVAGKSSQSRKNHEMQLIKTEGVQITGQEKECLYHQ